MKKEKILKKYRPPLIELIEIVQENSLATGSKAVVNPEDQDTGFIIINDWSSEETIDGIEGGSRW